MAQVSRTPKSLPKSPNILAPESKISLPERERRNRHLGCVLWLTGLSASGKSTIAAELERHLFQIGCQVFALDGDRLRHGLCKDLEFSHRDRTENIRRAGEVAKLFAEAGSICIAAFISPYRADRDAIRAILPPGRFIEIFVNAPLKVCEARDPKGLYARARKLKIKNFTGISAPYQPPLKPEIEVHTDRLDLAQTVEQIMRYLRRICRIKKAPAGRPTAAKPKRTRLQK